MDCIESGRGKGRACLLVLVERKSRETLLFKLNSQTQKLKMGKEHKGAINFNREKELHFNLQLTNRYGTLQEVDPRCRRKNNATSGNC